MGKFASNEEYEMLGAAIALISDLKKQKSSIGCLNENIGGPLP